MRRAVREGLERLDPIFRQALVLRDVSGLSYDEIAQALDLEAGTVKSRIFRARRKLAAHLMADGNIFAPEPSKNETKGGGEDA